MIFCVGIWIMIFVGYLALKESFVIPVYDTFLLVSVYIGNLISWQWIVGIAEQEFFPMDTMSKGRTVFLVSKVCTFYHLVQMASLFWRPPMWCWSWCFCFLISKRVCLVLWKFSCVPIWKMILCKLNLVLNSFSVSLIYLFLLFKVVSVTVALYPRHLVRHLPSRGQEFFLSTVI